MTYLAALVVQAKKLDPLVAAVRAAYASIGAVEGEGTRVVIGAPKNGWSTITDGTRHTVDLGVAAALAEELGARVLAIGLRGSSSYGKAASKAFGKWPKKPPSSGKPKAITDAVNKLGKELIPEPWEIDERPGVTLSFDLRAATCTPGPFKTNTASELRAAEQGAQQDATWHIANSLLNRRSDDAKTYLPGLRDTWGWQYAMDHVMHSLQSNSIDLEPGSARVFVALATRALEGITSKNLFDTWVGSAVGAGGWPVIRQALPLLCALVADDAAAWARFVAGIAPEHRDEYGLYVWTKSPVAIAKLSKKARALLDKDFPSKRILAWAVKAPHDAKNRWLDDAAQLAAVEGNNAVLDRAFAETADTYMPDYLHRAAMTLLYAKQFTPALVLFDRLLALPPKDLTVYTNALYAVQSDNNGMPVDRARAQRYLAAAAAHAEENTAIYINIACVQLELGDRAAMQAALDAMKRHKMRTELKELLAQPMFKKAKVK